MQKSLVALAMALVAGACASQHGTSELSTVTDRVPTETHVLAPTLAPTEISTSVPINAGRLDIAWDNFPPDINPLTGLQVANSAILDRRPIAVKISNFPRSNRPQWGLSLADIVYEYYHNNDLTRFHAIFYGQDAEMAGPIRSGRLFDSYLMDVYQSDLVYASADYRVRDRYAGEQAPWRLVSILEGDCPAEPVCRYEPETVNYLITDTSTVNDFARLRGGDTSRPDLRGMAFGSLAPADGTPLDRISVYYSISAYSYWDYDAANGRYYRFEDTQEDLGGRGQAYAPLTDRLTGEQIAADNVIVLFVRHFHYFYSPATDTKPITEVVDMDFEGQGLAYAFRDGQAYELQWVREEGQLLFLIDANGGRFPFKPGTTWFQVVNDKSQLTQETGAWRFKFIFRRP